MDLKTQVKLCIVGNFVTVAIVAIVTYILNDRSQYFKIGPNDGFVIISTKINTWDKYTIFLCLVTVVQIVRVMSEEIAMPILGFNIYNPDKKVITEFGKMELQILGNVMFFLSSLRGVFTLLVTISQMDVALFNVFISEVTTVVTIRYLLNKKTFEKETDELIELVVD